MKRISLFWITVSLFVQSVGAQQQGCDQLKIMRDQFATKGTAVSIMPDVIFHIHEKFELDAQGATLKFTKDVGPQMVVEPGGVLILKNINLVNYTPSSIQVKDGGTLAFGENVSISVRLVPRVGKMTKFYGIKPTTALHLQREREREEHGGSQSLLSQHLESEADSNADFVEIELAEVEEVDVAEVDVEDVNVEEVNVVEDVNVEEVEQDEVEQEDPGSLDSDDRVNDPSEVECSQVCENEAIESVGEAITQQSSSTASHIHGPSVSVRPGRVRPKVQREGAREREKKSLYMDQ